VSDPAPLLGITRHRNTERISLREMLHQLFRRRRQAAPAPRLPRPPASVLARRTTGYRPMAEPSHSGER
jgi:hypothetical protein